MMLLLCCTTMLQTALAIEYPWTFDNDLFGGESLGLLVDRFNSETEKLHEVTPRFFLIKVWQEIGNV
ncbi:unnamed protein product [Nippostrongylus brasiliensis]|uniref:Secreted protein n=1 Tax=Nippostrongylus brasiliensis TaxID=27835 RepID=A0A0N4XKU4_NIPBR|nr:unnamed protein product [Nippostrongylus brasiliensis]